MSDFWTSAVVNSTVLAAMAFIGKGMFQTWLAADLTQFKSKLEAEANKRNFTFQRIYEKRFEVVSTLYQKSAEADKAVKYAVGMRGNVKEGDIPGLTAKVTAFAEQYEITKIWLDDECCASIDKLLDQHTMFYKVLDAAFWDKNNMGQNWVGAEFLALWEQAEKDMPAVQENLRRAFQKTLDSVA